MTKARFSIAITKCGLAVIILTVFLIFAAKNTGNNLLFIMCSCFSTAILLSLYASWRNLKNLEFELYVPGLHFAGDSFYANCRIREKAGIARFYIAFESDFIRYLPARGEITLKTPLKVSERGIHTLHDFKIFSAYPIGLFYGFCRLEDISVPVGPRPDEQFPEAVTENNPGLIYKGYSNNEGEYWSQRTYTEGEDASLINWKLSARSSREWTIIRSLPAGSSSRIYFDFTGLSGDRFENALKIAAAIILRMYRSNNDASICIPDEHSMPRAISVKSGLPEIIKWLSEIEADAGWQCVSTDADTVFAAEWTGAV